MPQYYTLIRYAEDLESLEDFFTNAAAIEAEYSFVKWRRLFSLDTYAASVRILESFEQRSYEFLRIAKSINSSLHTELTRILYDSDLLRDLTTALIAIKIAAKKKTIISFTSYVQAYFFIITFGMLKLGHSFFKRLDIQQLIGSLHRLLQITKILVNEHIAIDDSETFTPSLISNDVVIEYIDNAIQILSEANIHAEQKRLLINQLIQTKQDFGEEKIPWKKVIGSLVITATLLSGLSDAPQAYENVNKAISYIIGLSVKKYVPPALPPGYSFKPTTQELPPGKEK